MKKNILILLFFFLPLVVFSKFYNGKVVYRNSETIDLEIKFPVKTEAKNLTVKINGEVKKIIADEIDYFVVFLNGGKSSFIFKRGKVGWFDKEGGIKPDNKGRFTLVKKVYNNLIVSETAIYYEVKKRKGEENMIAVFNRDSELTYGNFLFKPKDDLFFVVYNTQKRALKKSFERNLDYLFSDCPGFAEMVDYDELERGNYVNEIAILYDECIEANK